jgi:hypothetical protein
MKRRFCEEDWMILGVDFEMVHDHFLSDFLKELEIFD